MLVRLIHILQQHQLPRLHYARQDKHDVAQIAALLHKNVVLVVMMVHQYAYLRIGVAVRQIARRTIALMCNVQSESVVSPDGVWPMANALVAPAHHNLVVLNVLIVIRCQHVL